MIERKERLEEAARSARRTPESEARNALGQIAKDMAAAYEREVIDHGPPTRKPTATVTHKLCPSTKPVPAKIDEVTEKTYASKPTDWANDPGWSCLKFALNEPQAWQLEVKATATGFTAYARRKEGPRVREMQVRGKVDAAKQVLVIEPKIIDSKPD